MHTSNAKTLRVVCGAAMLFFFSLCTAAEMSWPERGADPYPWPKGGSKMLHDRFTQASTNSLGSIAELEAIKKAIVTQKAPQKVEVRDIHWLSPTSVMAYTRTEIAAFYYIAEKKKDKWEILTYYMLWVT